MIKNFLGDEDPVSEGKNLPDRGGASEQQVFSLFDPDPVAEKEEFVISTAAPESFADTTRKSGLAWSAGIVFFASITFMLILGWGADLLLGSSPWGLVGVIVLGSLIGFIQFFRLTSQIFKK